MFSLSSFFLFSSFCRWCPFSFTQSAPTSNRRSNSKGASVALPQTFSLFSPFPFPDRRRRASPRPSPLSTRLNSWPLWRAAAASDERHVAVVEGLDQHHSGRSEWRWGWTSRPIHGQHGPLFQPLPLLGERNNARTIFRGKESFTSGRIGRPRNSYPFCRIPFS